MGYYINPPGGNKQSWLDTNGVRVSQDTASRRKAGDEDQFVVCLVDNGWMDAAGIAYDDNELKAFLYEDGRPKKWYIVKREALKPYCKVL